VAQCGRGFCRASRCSHETRFQRARAAPASRQRNPRPQWLPGGRRRGHEWVCGDLSGGEGTSLSVNLLSGRWADFATSDRGGDLIDLYAAIHELTMAEAYRELDDGSTAAAPARPAKPTKPARTVVTPVPEAAADCECRPPHIRRTVGPLDVLRRQRRGARLRRPVRPARAAQADRPVDLGRRPVGPGSVARPEAAVPVAGTGGPQRRPGAHRRGRESRRRCGGDQRAVRRLHLARWRAGRQPR
jgi:hypothetical protein